MFYKPEELFEKLKEIIDIPEHVISFKLTLEIGNYPIVEIVRYANKNDDPKDCQVDFNGAQRIDERLTLISPTDLANLHIKIKALEKS